MLTNSETATTTDAKGVKTQRDAHLSNDGKWGYFPKVPNLVQYVRTGTYFARAKVKGKTFRQSLDTDIFTTAKLRLADKIKDYRKPPPEVGTFAQARALYEADLDAEHTLAEQSRKYRKNCIAALLRTWPELDEMKLEKISETGCREWAKRFAAKHDEQYFNNALGTLRMIIERGGIGHDANPARKIKRLGVKPKQLQLPEPAQFEKLLLTIETSGAGVARECADLVRFLAFSGCRISEARQVKWGDVDWQRGEIKIHNAKRSKTSGAHELRFVPIIPPMRQLLERLKAERSLNPTAFASWENARNH
ncbi:MAG TPA: site-specific integrase [Verrucomicrobiae bacterium]|jgi:integrase|nr:site-specific integrase [Verrucomicrobiae bacterium]